jgi:hypothetical protein
MTALGRLCSLTTVESAPKEYLRVTVAEPSQIADYSH